MYYGGLSTPPPALLSPPPSASISPILAREPFLFFITRVHKVSSRSFQNNWTFLEREHGQHKDWVRENTLTRIDGKFKSDTTTVFCAV